VEGKNLILKNWLQYENSFIKNLVTCRKRPTQLSAHDLRVAVKKMRSCLRLKKEFTAEEWKDSFSGIAALFRSFGRLRDYDISLMLLRKMERKEHFSFPFFKEYLCVNRSLARKWAKQNAIRFNEPEPDCFIEQFELLNGNQEETVERILRLSSLKIASVKNLAKHFHKNAHEIRKQLKDVYYWLRLCPKDVAESFINMKVFDRTLKYLGNFQDHFILKYKLRQYRKDLAKKSAERVMLKDLDRKLETSQKAVLDRAFKSWQVVKNKKATRIVALRAPERS
jgi:CHAD domain-containing protein